MPSFKRRRRSDVPRHTVRMSLGVNLAVLLVAAIATAAGIAALLWWAFGRPRISVTAPWTADQSLNLLKITLTVVGGIGGIVALVVAYRKQQLNEAAERREEAKFFAERFTKAAEQLGSDKAAVRLAGVYAMGGLADDWYAGRQTCIDVLCAYLRMPYRSEENSLPAAGHSRTLGLRQPGHGASSAPRGSEHDPADRGERHVRDTIIRLISTHLRPQAQVSWRGRNLDFTGAHFDGGDFSNAEFTSGMVLFERARFTGGYVHFQNAKFSGALVSFHTAEFAGGTVNFTEAEFSGGRVLFNDARFEGGTVAFKDTKFQDGNVSFGGAKLRQGIVFFAESAFSGTPVTFEGAEFAGTRVVFRDPADWSRPPLFDEWDSPPAGLVLPKHKHSDSQTS